MSRERRKVVLSRFIVYLQRSGCRRGKKRPYRGLVAWIKVLLAESCPVPGRAAVLDGNPGRPCRWPITYSPLRYRNNNNHGLLSRQFIYPASRYSPILPTLCRGMIVRARVYRCSRKSAAFCPLVQGDFSLVQVEETMISASMIGSDHHPQKARKTGDRPGRRGLSPGSGAGPCR